MERIVLPWLSPRHRSFTARPGQKPNSSWQTVHREAGDAHLSAGRVLEIEDLENAADAFRECSSKPNELLHGFLNSYVPNDSP
jgi:hypothetical protein